MGWDNPPMRWADLERVLSGRPARSRDETHPGDGGDSPAWTRHRAEYRPPPELDATPLAQRVPYAELHCHSNFSFLDGASHPEELVEQAVRLGLDAVAITDHDGMYGVVRFAEAAKELGMRTVYGAELNLGLSMSPAGVRTGTPDPPGTHLLVLARDSDGYRRLCRVITNAQLAGGAKGRPSYELEQVAAAAGGHWLVLTGCRKGSVRAALRAGDPAGDGMGAAERELRHLVELFGDQHVAVELVDHGLPADSEDNDALAELAGRLRLPTVATNAVHYALPKQRRLATVLAAVRARSSLDDLDGWLAPASTAHLRSGAEMAARFARYPGAVARAAEYGRDCAFDLRLVAPDLPPFDVPSPHTPASWLRLLARAGAAAKYGSYDEVPHAFHQIEHELVVIEGKNFPGYFLIVHDIVEFCRRAGILCQGRGSAANSAVCFALGITNVDAVANNLLFERFLAPDRDGYPDIDLDIESDRREEVIQYVYQRYGRERAAQVANVITYRSRSAVRDVARALGHGPGAQDAWSKQLDRWGPLDRMDVDDIPEQVTRLAAELEGFPRHLGIHSGGMVLCDRPVGEVCPVEWARMDRRSVLQWDKDDCAAAGLVKFDLLGLGMLAALHYVIDLVAEWHGRKIALSDLAPNDPLVYDMLCRADSVGVFQVESRAQMATLPRLRPRRFYDLVVEVALIRPGPIQGGSVHPYIRRRSGAEKDWRYDHDLLRPALKRTYGVPLFQEQLMQIAVDVAGFTAAEADELRRAMGAKRSTERMERLRGRFFAGMARKGVGDEVAQRIFEKLLAFANFGFPESHSISFASLVYASAWFKYYYPAAFCAALLRAQPMGFYSPQSLIADARRHGVRVHGPDVNASLVDATLEPLPGWRRPSDPPGVGPPPRGQEPDVSVAIRLGLGSVRSIGDKLAGRIAEERAANGPYAGMADVARRIGLTVGQAEALATAGAFGEDRRRALWAAGAAAQERADRLPGIAAGVRAPELPGMTELELSVADVWATGVSPNTFPTQFFREHLDELGVVTAGRLTTVEAGERVLVAGAVTHRQRPATAGGVTFLNLEDETGMVNVVCSPGLWVRYRRVARASPALVVRGRVEKAEGVVTLVAERVETLDLGMASRSRDFR